MNALINNSNCSTTTFLPKHTTRVFERKIEVSQRSDGSTVRTMTETIVVELNQDLLTQLFVENQSLKQQLEASEKAAFSLSFENYAALIAAAMVLYWKYITA